MKLKTKVLLCLVLATLACAHPQNAAGRVRSESAQGAGWARYTYPGEEFSVELPGMPALHNGARAGGGRRPFGDLKVRVFSLYRDGVIYFVVAYDEPRSAESLELFAKYLRGAWELEPKGPLTLGGFEGHAYTVVGTQRGRLMYDLRGEGRVFRAKRHAYLALAITEEDGRPEVARFLDSLALEAGPAGERIAEEEPVPRFVPPESPPEPPARAMLGLRRGEPLGPGDRRALIVYKPEPGYTEEARKKRVGGTVILRVVLATDGSVTNVEPTRWLPNGLTERAIRAARQMLFFPARTGGQPVSQNVTLEYNFSVY